MSNQSVNQHPVKYVPAGSGPKYLGPGDSVTFLLTGQESRGSCFIVEGLVVPGGGPPPHVHHHEDETFYMLEGEATFTAGGQTIRAKAGDFIHVPRGTVHTFRGEGTKPGRALVIISPAGPTGMQQLFEQSFTPATDRNVSPPAMDEALMQRMMQAAVRNGLEWVKPQ